MTDTKTLLIDVGGTLLTRTRPGPISRALEAIGESRESASGHRHTTLARCLLTGDVRDVAVSRAVEALRLPQAKASDLLAAIREPEGEPVVLPGAVELLRRARETGWRIIAVTNVSQWNDYLPDQVRNGLDAVVSSADLGVIKHDREFWVRLRERHGVDSRHSVLAGDSPVPDGCVPAAEGFCTVLIGSGGPGLAELTNWLARAALPPTEAAGVAAGCAQSWAGQRILPAPHLAAVVVSVTRFRVRVSLPGGRIVGSTVVRRRAEPPALLLPPAAADAGLFWLAPVIDRRSDIMPADLAEVLAARQSSLDGISERERRHLISMVREARDPGIRQQRIADVVAYLGAGSEPGGAAGD